MDVDPPVFTQISKVYTEADKSRFCKEGCCFYCDLQGHMARECPYKKAQQKPTQGLGYPKKQFMKHHGYRKTNQYKPRPHQNPKARMASIEEMEPEDDNEPEEEEEVTELAAHTSKLSAD